jgi:hypothetical protein
MRTIVGALAILAVALLPSGANAESAGTMHATAPAMTGLVHPAAVVPTGQTYKFYVGGRLVASVASGQAWHRIGGLTQDTNCVQIECPSSFKTGTVCWVCHTT